MVQVRVRKSDRDNDGNTIGWSNEYPILDIREYVVEFKDGTEAELVANDIAQSMYAQCDPYGHTYVLFDSITNFRRSTASLFYEDQTVRKVDGLMFLRISNAGWQLFVLWKDGSIYWENLSELKESHPLETAEYAVYQSLEREPAFNWWVPFSLKKRACIIYLVQQRSAFCLKRNQKYVINLPKTVEEALMFDKENGNTLWSDAIAKEMTNVKVAFRILDDNESVPRNHQFVKFHMIFDVKMENFRWKARLVAGGHMTKAPAAVIHASIVSH